MELTLPSGPRYILEKLNSAGFEAFLVGGCVRDWLRGTEPEDWDVCTRALPGEIQEVFSELEALETGLRHGTVTVLVKRQPYEITTYRADGEYSDGRHPDEVSFVTSLTQDLARRDFTVNAMALGLDGVLHDPFGGAEDLKRGLIRCVGDPDRRFQEDGLRLMRAVRFSATLGYAIHPDTAAALSRNLSMLDKVARERIQAEVKKLLMGRDAVGALRAYPEVFCRFWPQLKPLVELEQNCPWHCWGGWEHTLRALAAAPGELTLRLAVLLHDVGKAGCKTTDEEGRDHFYGHAALSAELADEMLRELKFDNATRQRTVTLVARHDLPLEPRAAVIRRWLNRLGEETFFQLLEVQRCDALGQSPELAERRLAENETLRELAREIVDQGQCFTIRDLAVDGRDVMALGVAPGPEVGRTLERLLEAVMAGQTPNERQALLERVKSQEKSDK